MKSKWIFMNVDSVTTAIDQVLLTFISVHPYFKFCGGEKDNSQTLNAT